MCSTHVVACDCSLCGTPFSPPFLTALRIYSQASLKPTIETFKTELADKGKAKARDTKKWRFDCYLQYFGRVACLLLWGFLVSSWGLLGANLASPKRLLDPKRVRKLSKK